MMTDTRHKPFISTDKETTNMELTNDVDTIIDNIEDSLNTISCSEAQKVEMMNAALSNILGNIEMIMLTIDESSEEYVKLLDLKQQAEDIIGGIQRWRFRLWLLDCSRTHSGIWISPGGRSSRTSGTRNPHI